MQALTRPEAAPADISVWRLTVGRVAAEDWRVLTPPEQARAGRFHHDADRARYVGARAGLRRLLAMRLGLAPAQVPLCAGKHGKPVLAPGAFCYFNVSHAGGCALVALSDCREVGVDVECEPGTIDLESLAGHALLPAERTGWRGLPPAAAFLRRWTGKEAALKAWGVGVAQHLLQVQVQPGGQAGQIAVAASCADWPTCEACELAMPAGYVAALAWLPAVRDQADPGGVILPPRPARAPGIRP
ncbi:4'-phosphopantetheinyl transferase family protein [Achromobacter marplatensis]|uniref:4'-phosphopantetheinyl transferase family protein n=1 Tax=Achromobacter marplatensis TaxID=470868 RepID=UPI0039F6D313